MNKKELQELHKKISAEKEIAEKKLQEVERLHEEVQEEFNARSGMLFSIERMLNLQEN